MKISDFIFFVLIVIFAFLSFSLYTNSQSKKETDIFHEEMINYGDSEDHSLREVNTKNKFLAALVIIVIIAILFAIKSIFISDKLF